MFADRHALRSALAAVCALGLAGAAAAAEPAQGASLGRSVEGRQIPLVRMGQPDAAARVLVVGSIHGDEPGGLAVTRRLRRRPPPSGSRCG